ncbi:cold-shock protein [Clostridium psychrophilum]|uniref:cold-shock protein n=1 Tax=Clostridium psychrophilum TaxID=132926 RepID=UPI001C0E33E9|nr:cold-shock protein [Clostridium psychrophilum]MBU3182228.1 cold-shock protein [Clostridium psychrophilum]
MKTGIVKWYDCERGYGFISAQNGEDVFVHHSSIKEEGARKNLHEGEEVQFDVVDGVKGLQASNVQR